MTATSSGANNERRWQTVATHVSDQIILLDAAGETIETAGNGGRILGHPAEFWEEASPVALVHPQDLEVFRRLIVRALAHPGQQVTSQVRLRDAAGVWAALEVSIWNHLDDEAVQGLVMTGRDVTELRRLENELLDARRRRPPAGDPTAHSRALAQHITVVLETARALLSENLRAGDGLDGGDKVSQIELLHVLLQEAEEAAALLGVPAPGDRDTPPAKVLLVEDNVTNRTVLMAQLAALGVAAVAVADGTEAVARCTGGEYDLVLMDLHLLTLDGAEATALIRAAEARSGRPRTPIVAISARSDDFVRRACLEAGMDDVLTKPLARSALRAAVERWIPAAGRAHAETAEAPGPSSPPVQAAAGERATADPAGDGPSADGALAELLRSLDDPGAVAMIVDVFLSELNNRVQAILRSLRARDCLALYRAAHTLRAPTLMLGAFELAEICQRCEDAADGDFAGTDVAELERALRAAEKRSVALLRAARRSFES